MYCARATWSQCAGCRRILGIRANSMYGDCNDGDDSATAQVSREGSEAFGADPHESRDLGTTRCACSGSRGKRSSRSGRGAAEGRDPGTGLSRSQQFCGDPRQPASRRWTAVVCGWASLGMTDAPVYRFAWNRPGLHNRLCTLADSPPGQLQREVRFAQTLSKSQPPQVLLTPARARTWKLQSVGSSIPLEATDVRFISSQ